MRAQFRISISVARSVPAVCEQLRLNMFHATKGFQIFCSVLAQGALVMSTIPIPNSGLWPGHSR